MKLSMKLSFTHAGNITELVRRQVVFERFAGFSGRLPPSQVTPGNPHGGPPGQPGPGHGGGGGQFPPAWSATGNLATALTNRGGAGSSAGGSIVYGGWLNNGTNLSNETNLYNSGTNTWSLVNTLPVFVSQMAISIGTGTSALCVGGIGGGGPSATSTYIWNGVSWSAGNGMSTGRASFGGCGDSTAALVWGGQDNPATQYFSSAETYNGSVWGAAGALGAVYGDAPVGAGTNTAAIKVGGITPFAGSRVATVQTYNGTAWAGGTAYPTTVSRGGMSGISTNCFYVGGIEVATNATSHRLWNGTAWSLVTNILVAKRSFGMTATSQSTLVLGGGIAATELNTGEVYR